jgi:DnaJ like chaperone protein
MSVWSQLSEMAQAIFSGEDAGDRVSGPAAPGLPSGPDAGAPTARPTGCSPDPDDVGFTAAVVGLGAKLAKADGLVTEDEVAMFSRVFQTAPEDADSVRRVFNLARQTVVGYENYAKRIAKRYSDRPCLLEGVLDALFLIAAADGVITKDELNYLESVAAYFGFSADTLRRIKATHLGGQADDPYAVLGLQPSVTDSQLRAAWRRLMAEHHPDRIVAQGAPEAYRKAAHDKAAALNAAYVRIRTERGQLLRAD